MIWVLGLQLVQRLQLLELHNLQLPVDHGLIVGNKFRVLNGSDANLGDFVVKSVTDVDTFLQLKQQVV